MQSKFLFLRWMVGFAIGSCCPAADLTVFAAASLSNALQEIASLYEKESGHTVRFNLAASSLLARQIKEGAPADVFFSADDAKMDELAGAGLIVKESRHPLLSNTLVIIVPNGSAEEIMSPSDLTSDGIRRLALGDTATVPAGVYARSYLQRVNLWEKVSRKVVAMDNVRSALAAVESGNASAGIVYKTDALISKKVRIAYEIPAAEGPKINYPIAALHRSKQPERSRHFITFLSSPTASEIFQKFGFTLAN